MGDFLNSVFSSKERAIPMAILFLGFAVVAGKFRLESIEQDLHQLKSENKKLEEILNRNATTWAKIAERVKIYHKE